MSFVLPINRRNARSGHVERAPALSLSKGFTLVEVMMASVILVVGFIGMIEAVTISARMMDHARRQTVATQILNHEIEQLRLESWATIQTLPTSTTWAVGTGYAVGAVVNYQGGWFACVSANTGHPPAESNYWSAYMAWTSTTAYKKSDLVSSGGTWYRCIAANTAQTPPNATYWTTYSGPSSTSGTNSGATYTITRSVNNIDTDSDGVTDLSEVTFTVTWAAGTSRRDSLTAFGNQLTFTYTRVQVAYFGKYGLNLSYQRS